MMTSKCSSTAFLGSLTRLLQMLFMLSATLTFGSNWKRYNFGMSWGRCGASSASACAAMEENPIDAPRREFHTALWDARDMNLYTRSGCDMSDARERML